MSFNPVPGRIPAIDLYEDMAQNPELYDDHDITQGELEAMEKEQLEALPRIEDGVPPCSLPN